MTAVNHSHVRLGDAGVLLLLDGLRENGRVSFLGLRNVGLGDDGAAAVAGLLRTGASALTTVDLAFNTIGDEGARALAMAVCANSRLTRLNLGHNQVGDAGAVVLAEAIRGNAVVNDVDLAYNEIGDVGASALAKALLEAESSLALDVGHNELGDIGATAMANAVRVSGCLKRISFGNNTIGDAGVRALADALKCNASVEVVDLDCNHISDDGAIAIAEALLHNVSVTRLSLARNEIADEGTSALADALLVNTSVTEVNLQFNFVGDVGALDMADAMRVNSSVVRIDLEENGISEYALKAVVNSTQINSKLSSHIALEFASHPDANLAALLTWIRTRGADGEFYPSIRGIRRSARLLAGHGEATTEPRVSHVVFRLARVIVTTSGVWPCRAKVAGAICRPAKEAAPAEPQGGKKAPRNLWLRLPSAIVSRIGITLDCPTLFLVHPAFARVAEAYVANELSLSTKEANMFVYMCAAGHNG